MQKSEGGGVLLELSQVSKSFFGVQVLHEVDFSVDAGEVHAVVGENGAGKSTLMKIASGAYQPDSGTIRLAGHPVTFRGPRDAQAAGVGIIHQEFNLLPERTVAQNVFLGHEPARRGFVDRKAMQTRTAELLASVGADDLAPDVIVGRLGVAQQQIVEIVKALALDARVLIMDEPTASLADHEVQVLYALVRRLQQRGIGIVYVSHRLTEVFDLAGRITVLKDGRWVTTLDTSQATPEALVRHMVGRELAHYYPPRSAGAGAERLAVSAGGNAKLRDIDLRLHAGE